MMNEIIVVLVVLAVLSSIVWSLVWFKRGVDKITVTSFKISYYETKLEDKGFNIDHVKNAKTIEDVRRLCKTN